MSRLQYGSGTPWETQVGYSRVVRVGSMIEVAGTTASNEHGEVVGIDDAYAQTVYILEKIGRALTHVGASYQHVVRTRIFVTRIADWEAVGRAHGEVFRTIRPVSTMVEVSALINPAMLVEIEVSAIIEEDA